MKKITSWSTNDGKTFPSRKLALAHEIHLTRVEAIEQFFRTALKDNPLAEADSHRLAEVISKQARAFSVVISARAARSVAGLPGPKRHKSGVPMEIPVLRKTASSAAIKDARAS